MTLVMTLIRPEGIWQSADHRVMRAGKIADDATPKQLAIRCAPLDTPPDVLLGFTGAAEAPDGAPTLQWIRETLRGKSLFVQPMLELLRDRLTHDFSGSSRTRRVPLIITGGVLEPSGRRVYFEITNVDPPTWTINGDFHLAAGEVPKPAFFAGGSGAPYISADDLGLVKKQLNIQPANWEDHLGLLAAVNRRTADLVPDKSVSPWCDATYFSVESEGAKGRAFYKPGDPPAELNIEMLIAGVDGGELLRGMLDQARKGIPLTEERARKAIEGRP
jgi:hypothetical protein